MMSSQLFQFYKVRLKRCRNRSRKRRKIWISILQSSIKTRPRGGDAQHVLQFQFYKVRLKQPGYTVGGLLVEFQFYKVRLKRDGAGKRHQGCGGFQFYKVRLKPCEIQRNAQVSLISILQSSIKTHQQLVRVLPDEVFQFYKVRLKREGIQERSSAAGGISILQSSIKTIGRGHHLRLDGISILQSSIKTGCGSLSPPRPRHFNSTKFD